MVVCVPHRVDDPYDEVMAERNPDRSSYFPAIEKKTGQPMSYWFDVMAEIKNRKYPEQMAYLQENHGFSRAHANALVLYSRGSKSSRRFETHEQYLAQLDADKAKTVQSIFATIVKAHPNMEPVIAWNQPMLKLGKDYVIGVTAGKEHILLGPWGDNVIERFRPRLEGYEINKKTIRIPVGWKVDKALLLDIVGSRVAEIEG